MPASIFVSYSHQDIGLVQPVVRLLRATEDLVFQDLDSIKPGRKWRREIGGALYAAHLVVLFWCYHSSRSAEVRREYELALTTGKDVLPVLLDTTPLPEQLNEFQWVDFRLLVGSAHRSYRRWIFIVLIELLAGLIVGFLLFFAASMRPSIIHGSIARPIPPSSQMIELALLALLVTTMGVLAVWMVRKVLLVDSDYRSYRHWAILTVLSTC